MGAAGNVAYCSSHVGCCTPDQQRACASTSRTRPRGWLAATLLTAAGEEVLPGASVACVCRSGAFGMLVWGLCPAGCGNACCGLDTDLSRALGWLGNMFVMVGLPGGRTTACVPFMAPRSLHTSKSPALLHTG